jgi:hypothetical protein
MPDWSQSRDIITAPAAAKSFGSLRIRLRNTGRLKHLLEEVCTLDDDIALFLFNYISIYGALPRSLELHCCQVLDRSLGQKS